MIHYKHERVEYSIQHAQGHLFRKVGDNLLINAEFGFYVISRGIPPAHLSGHA
jgi:hypothetical protein